MILAKVTGQVVATIKHPSYDHQRMLLLAQLDANGKETGAYLVAVDGVDARDGQTVLVIDEGNSARQVLGDAEAPVRSVIVGIVDAVETE